MRRKGEGESLREKMTTLKMISIARKSVVQKKKRKGINVPQRRKDESDEKCSRRSQATVEGNLEDIEKKKKENLHTTPGTSSRVKNMSIEHSENDEKVIFII